MKQRQYLFLIFLQIFMMFGINVSYAQVPQVGQSTSNAQQQIFNSLGYPPVNPNNLRPNAILHGVPLDGSTAQSAMQTWRSTVGASSYARFYIPPGTLAAASGNLTINSGSQVLWDIDAKPPSGSQFFYFGGGDVVHTHLAGGGEWWYQLATVSSSAPVLRSDRTVGSSVGPNVQINDTVPPTGTPSGQITSLDIVTNAQSTISGQAMVGIYQAAWRCGTATGVGPVCAANSTQPLYGVNFSVASDTGTYDGVATIGGEYDVIGNGDWVTPGTFQAGIFDGTLARNNTSGTAFKVPFGVRMTNTNGNLAEGGFAYPFLVTGTNVYTSAFSTSASATLAAGAVNFDASLPTYTDAVGIGLRLGAGHAIDFGSNSTALLRLVTGLWAFQNSGTTEFSIDTSGNTTAAGTVRGNAFNVAGTAGASCGAGTVSLTTLVIVNGIVTHC